MEDTEENPKAAHDTNVYPRKDIAQALASADISITAEEVVYTPLLGVLVLCSGDDDPRSGNAEGCSDNDTMESNVSAVQSGFFLKVPSISMSSGRETTADALSRPQ
jgi:hypothetical protein